MSTFAQDLRCALRTFLESPGFTLAALLSLALGIGANAAIFSVASALILTPLPYADADRLVILWNRSPGLGIAEDWFSTAQYFDIKSSHSGFDDIGIAIGDTYNLTGDGVPERIGVIHVSSNLLPMLGARPVHGRLFVPEEDRPGGPQRAILGHGAWMRRYGGDPAVIGRTVILNGKSTEIVGVLPEAFTLRKEVIPTLYGAADAEIMLTLPLGSDAATIRTHEDYNIVGKLKPGVTVTQAQAEMDALTARLRREFPANYPPNGGLTFGIVALADQVVGDVRLALLVLLASVGFVLLIACANVANLMLSRAVARQREIAVRAALGASRARLVGQLLTESVALAMAGGALGVLLAIWGVGWIHRLGTTSVPRLHEVAVDWRVLLFTLVVSVGSGVLFGLVPALRLSRVDLQANLKDASRGASASSALWGHGPNTRRLLVVAELALSVMLLIGASLLVRSFSELQRVSPGFNPENVLTFELSMNGPKYEQPQRVIDTYRAIWQRLEALAGVEASGVVSALPLSQMFAWGPITVEGRTPPAGEQFINVDMRSAGGAYFEAMQIPLIEGRLFTEHDVLTAPRVVVIDDRMAAELWPNESSIGKRLHRGGVSDTSAPWMTVIGVVGRIKQYTLEGDSRIAMYFPHTQFPWRSMNVVLRSAGDPGALATTVANELRAIDPDLPLYRVMSMTTRVEESLARRRFSMLLLTLFAGLALGLAAIGIYGVMSSVVSQGTRELGIRLALGATPEGIVRLIVGHGMLVALVGLGVGVGVAFVGARAMEALLFGVAPRDPLTFALIPLLLALVALAACYTPARRAARIDPVVSLRSE
jgi:predicted permease